MYCTQRKKSQVIAIYQLAPPMKLLSPMHVLSNVAHMPSPSVNRALHAQGEYEVAILNFTCMAIILLNVVTLKSSTLQLESVRLQCHSSLVLHMTDILTFSPDARLLTVCCYMENESMNACLITDVSKLETLFWMAADGGCCWQRWLFPMFSACGTKMVLLENEDDESKYKLMFYKISSILSLKDLYARSLFWNVCDRHCFISFPLQKIKI